MSFYNHWNILFGHLLAYQTYWSLLNQRTRRKLQLQATSNEEICQDKGSSNNLSSVVDSQPLKTKPSTRSPLKPQIQTSQESKESEKVEIPEQSKPKEMALVPVLNPIPQSFITIPNVGDTIPSQPIKSPNCGENCGINYWYSNDIHANCWGNPCTRRNTSREWEDTI